MRNIELKVSLDRFNDIKNVLKKIGADFKGILFQKDTYYNYKGGRLKIREINESDFELISYKRPDRKNSKISDYQVIDIAYENFGVLKDILNKIFGEKIVVAKKRELWIYKNTRIHLDRVAGLGNFLELETEVNNINISRAESEHNKIKDLLNLLRFEKFGGSYSDILMIKKQGLNIIKT